MPFYKLIFLTLVPQLIKEVLLANGNSLLADIIIVHWLHDSNVTCKGLTVWRIEWNLIPFQLDVRQYGENLCRLHIDESYSANKTHKSIYKGQEDVIYVFIVFLSFWLTYLYFIVIIISFFQDHVCLSYSSQVPKQSWLLLLYLWQFHHS